MARGYDDDAPCGRPATVRVTAACRHEHVSHDDVCGECVASLLGRQMVCVSCDELPVGAHVCPSVLVETAALATRGSDTTSTSGASVGVAIRAHA